ncbi:hypothetical protein THASP1DRAFT_9178, partial [Thamnocephalis sphaerospora]
VRYDGHQVLRVRVGNEAEMNVLAAAIEQHKLDIWSPIRVGHVDVRVAPSANTTVAQMIGLPYTVLISDVQTLVAQQQMPAYAVNNTDGRLPRRLSQEFFKQYQGFEEQAALFAEIADYFSDWAERVSLGRTYEGREIFGIRIHRHHNRHPLAKSKDAAGKDDKEAAAYAEHERRSDTADETPRRIVIVGGTHAREWVSTAVASYLAYALASGYASNPQIGKMVDEFEFTIFPLINADGYEYSRTTDRLWRKNRQPTTSPHCTGTDLNRNWDYQWGRSSTDRDSCSEYYAGSEAFSAPEVHALAQYLKERKTAIAFLDLHSYSQLWMHPFAARCRRVPDNKENMLELALGAAETLRRVNGVRYDVGSACQIIYQQFGTALDWVHAKAHVPYSYWIELRDTGAHGFLLPPEQIIPSGEETFAAL